MARDYAGTGSAGMTSEVMEVLTFEPTVSPRDANDSRLDPEARTGKRPLMTRNLALALVAFVSFTVFSTWVAVEDGPLGFLTLAAEGGWGLQMLLDIGISLVVASFWIVADARRHGLNPWPFIAASVGLGSIGALAYLVYRELRLSSAVRSGALTA